MNGPSSWPKPLGADSHAAETSRIMEDRIIRFGVLTFIISLVGNSHFISVTPTGRRLITGLLAPALPTPNNS